ncbi:hypothetical protein H696_02343 [Fonticula alba]|uniref:Maspardin n=1 Tax=Fonticula alba TaxID=691883 RepID=A0A058ZAJ2_FONAL|nr:hypothetical protein H696_02343 [Fonticula alba]KCV71395.1 hypothetical protein H696_02343 [Fonticula alba]|eukprot:XP_009494518.1 hypothetical protein H696_02343 [Fonticula alba]
MSGPSVGRATPPPGSPTFVPISQSPDYMAFRRLVAHQKKICQVAYGKCYEWGFYDCKPLNSSNISLKSMPTLLCIPHIGGTAASFFRLASTLSARGFRVIAVDYPPVDSHFEFGDSLNKFLESLDIDQVHILGNALGGFLAQHFAFVHPQGAKRVLSLVLINSFCSTRLFSMNTPYMGFFNWAPEFALKRILLRNLPQKELPPALADSIDFMVDQIESLSRDTIVSRLILNTISLTLSPALIRAAYTNRSCAVRRVTLVESMEAEDDNSDAVAVSTQLRDECRECYTAAFASLTPDVDPAVAAADAGIQPGSSLPNDGVIGEVRSAYIRGGGNFPFLSHTQELAMLVRVHMLPFSELAQEAEATAAPDGVAVPDAGTSAGSPDASDHEDCDSSPPVIVLADDVIPVGDASDTSDVDGNTAASAGDVDGNATDGSN